MIQVIARFKAYNMRHFSSISDSNAITRDGLERTKTYATTTGIEIGARADHIHLTYELA